MQIKICGITRPEDAQKASALGADAVGLVFWSGSQRAVSVDQAQVLCRELAPFVTVTALLVNATANELETILASVPVNLLQFHGDETPAFCEQWSIPYIRALPAAAGTDLITEASRYTKARGFLVDAVHEGKFGGTGTQFDWTVVPKSFKSTAHFGGRIEFC